KALMARKLYYMTRIEACVIARFGRTGPQILAEALDRHTASLQRIENRIDVVDVEREHVGDSLRRQLVEQRTAAAHITECVVQQRVISPTPLARASMICISHRELRYAGHCEPEPRTVETEHTVGGR